MRSPDSSLVRSEYADGEIRFELPVRPLRALRWVGLCLVAFGIILLWRPARLLWRALENWSFGMTTNGNAFAVLFELPFVLVGSLPILLGLLALLGRCRVSWREGEIRVTELLGPLRWTRRVPLMAVQALAISAPAAAPTASDRHGFAALAIEFVDATEKLLVIGYPASMLWALAEQLKVYLRTDVAGTRAGHVPVVERC